MTYIFQVHFTFATPQVGNGIAVKIETWGAGGGAGFSSGNGGGGGVVADTHPLEFCRDSRGGAISYQIVGAGGLRLHQHLRIEGRPEATLGFHRIPTAHIS